MVLCYQGLVATFATGAFSAMLEITMNPVIISQSICSKTSATSRPLALGLAVIATAAFALAGTSCATSKGFGRDVKKVGNKIENAADRTGGAN